MFQYIAETTFYEKINLTKLKHIVANPQKYKDIIEEQERDMRRHDKHYNAFATFQKIINNCYIPKELEGTEYALIKVSYKKGTNSNNIGRWYANKAIGLQSLVCCVRHTICEGIWVDIDQVNSHPTIFKTFMNTYGFNSDLLNECLNNREVFLKRVGGDRDKAKTQVIAVINGTSYPNNKVLHQLSFELKECIDHVINLPEYKDILEYVTKTYDKNVEGKTKSIPFEVKARTGKKPKAITQNDIMYLIMPDRFANADTTNDYVPSLGDRLKRNNGFARHGGDLKGIGTKLDYLKELGITTMWINPVIENANKNGSYHGYGFTNFYAVDARFGSHSDYATLVTDAHNKGIKTEPAKLDDTGKWVEKFYDKNDIRFVERKLFA
jgi:hypothetical protein